MTLDSKPIRDLGNSNNKQRGLTSSSENYSSQGIKSNDDIGDDFLPRKAVKKRGELKYTIGLIECIVKAQSTSLYCLFL